MAKITINTEALTSSASVLDTKITELLGLNARLEELINRIGDSWEGDACTAYLNVMRNYAAQAKKMEALLEEYKNYVEKAVGEFSEIDRNAAARIRSAF